MNTKTLMIPAILASALTACTVDTGPLTIPAPATVSNDIGQGCPTHEQDFDAPKHKNCGGSEISQRAVTGISPSVTTEPEPEEPGCNAACQEDAEADRRAAERAKREAEA